MRMRSVGLLYSFGRLLRIVFIDDPGLKLLCVVFATLMWFYIDGELMSQKEYELQMKASDIELTDSLELSPQTMLPTFKVIVRGPRRQVEFWPHENLRFKHKLLGNPQPGLNAINVAASDVEAEGFTVVSVEPKDPGGATVNLLATAQQMKHVRVRMRNEPKEQFLVGKPVADPAQVRVKGAKSDLDSISEVWTEEVDLAGAEQKISVEVPIAETMELKGKSVKIQCDEKVRVTVPIDPRTEVRPQTLDVLGRAPSGMVMFISPQTVTVEVVVEGHDLKDPDTFSKISLYVECPFDRPKDNGLLGPVPVQVKFSAPPRVQVRGVNNGPLPTVNVSARLAEGTK